MQALLGHHSILAGVMCHMAALCYPTTGPGYSNPLNRNNDELKSPVQQQDLPACAATCIGKPSPLLKSCVDAGIKASIGEISGIGAAMQGKLTTPPPPRGGRGRICWHLLETQAVCSIHCYSPRAVANHQAVVS